MTTRLGILTTHPIQYQAPWFRLLAAAEGVDLTVFYCMIPDDREQGRDFGVAFKWDIPLLDGYRYEVLENIARNATSARFGGCDTPGIESIVKDGAFDAFVVNGWLVKSYIQLLAACRRQGVPVLVRGESNDLRPRSWWKALAHRALLSQYSACLYIGEGNRRFYLKSGVQQERLFFTPYCVENERLSRAASDLQGERNAIRSSWGISGNAVTFLFCGKFIEKKRPMDILRALAELRRTAMLPGAVHLLMVGTGALLDSCRQFALEQRLPVTFAGFLNQSEIARAYVASDCLILPSDHGETWGLVVNEGMACGLPAIVSDQVGCHLDLITPAVTGYVYPMGHVSALASCVRQAASGPGQLRAMGCAAKERISTYSYGEVVKGTLEAMRYVRRRR